jgi:ribosomal protein L32
MNVLPELQKQLNAASNNNPYSICPEYGTYVHTGHVNICPYCGTQFNEL